MGLMGTLWAFRSYGNSQNVVAGLDNFVFELSRSHGRVAQDDTLAGEDLLVLDEDEVGHRIDFYFAYGDECVQVLLDEMDDRARIHQRNK